MANNGDENRNTVNGGKSRRNVNVFTGQKVANDDGESKKQLLKLVKVKKLSIELQIKHSQLIVVKVEKF